MSDDCAVAKLDFKNAFNCLNRSRMLADVHSTFPEIYKFCYLSYHGTSILKYNDHNIESAVGVQQGDPLGPLLFSLIIHPLLMSLSCPLEVAYLDDVTLGGNKVSLVSDIEIIIEKGRDLGLELNLNKCELISSRLLSMKNPIFDSFSKLTTSESTLLGAPL